MSWDGLMKEDRTWYKGILKTCLPRKGINQSQVSSKSQPSTKEYFKQWIINSLHTCCYNTKQATVFEHNLAISRATWMLTTGFQSTALVQTEAYSHRTMEGLQDCMQNDRNKSNWGIFWLKSVVLLLNDCQLTHSTSDHLNLSDVTAQNSCEVQSK